MLCGEALPDLERRLDALQEQAVAKLLDKVCKGGRLQGGIIPALMRNSLLPRPCRTPPAATALIFGCSSLTPIPTCLSSPQGFSKEQVSCQRFLNLRYDGTDVPIMTPAPADGDFAAAFEQAYQVQRGLRWGRNVFESATLLLFPQTDSQRPALVDYLLLLPISCTAARVWLQAGAPPHPGG